MAKVYQAVKTKAKNPNAKYKVKYVYKQYNVDYSTVIKYTYSKTISLLNNKKYSYAM